MDGMLNRVTRKFKSIYLRTYLHSFDRFVVANPQFEQIDPRIVEESRGKLRRAYELYVSEISSAEMAASLELSTFLYNLCKVNNYKKIVDLGSGFSSYVFRFYAKEIPGVEVISVDDDAKWLQRTMDFVASHDLDTKGMMTMEEFLSRDHGFFDCILLDLNFVEERVKYVQRILPMARPGGLIIFDDVHKPDYMLDTLEILSLANGKVYSLSPATLDSYGRYSMAYRQPD